MKRTLDLLAERANSADTNTTLQPFNKNELVESLFITPWMNSKCFSFLSTLLYFSYFIRCYYELTSDYTVLFIMWIAMKYRQVVKCDVFKFQIPYYYLSLMPNCDTLKIIPWYHLSKHERSYQNPWWLCLEIVFWWKVSCKVYFQWMRVSGLLSVQFNRDENQVSTGEKV